jgi:hypothetical protein
MSTTSTQSTSSTGTGAVFRAKTSTVAIGGEFSRLANLAAARVTTLPQNEICPHFLRMPGPLVPKRRQMVFSDTR